MLTAANGEAGAEPAAGSAPLPADEREHAAARLAEAAAGVAADLDRRAEAAAGEARDVLEATALMAADPTLLADAQRRVREAGTSADRAVWEAAEGVVATLTALGGYMAERVGDVRDVRDRLIAHLQGRVLADPLAGVVEPVVLIARDLAPADTAVLDLDLVLALVTTEGGPTSHTAVLARALGLPAVVAVRGLELASVDSGSAVLVDGLSGQVVLEPSPQESSGAATSRVARTGWLERPGATADGHPVALLANVGDPASARAAADAGAEGVGLFRTEFCFLDRTEAPSHQEQVEAYRSVLDAFGGKLVVVRTLDAGADKPLPFVTVAGEPNPALGVRGLRTRAGAPEVLTGQLAALADAARGSSARVAVMAPMVATAQEAAEFVALANAAGLDDAGVMVEVPAAALCADEVLAACSFASLGTNDLGQYALAADRQLGQLADLLDPWQPALLRLVAMTCEAGSRQARPVGVCGEAAADPLLACVLVGLGASSLSASAGALPAVGKALARVTLAQCRAASHGALAASSPRTARSAAQAALDPTTPVQEER